MPKYRPRSKSDRLNAKRTRRTRGSLKRFLAYVLLILVLAHITLNFSLFGTGERANKYTQDLINTYAGDWLYPQPHTDITVLLLTDQALAKHQRGHWPVSYDFHGRILNTLLKHRPKAVFVDFLWLSQRADATADGRRDGDYLIKTLHRYQELKIPVYLASVPALRYNWPELDSLVTHVAAHFDIDSADFVSRTYPATKNNVPTPAFQMAQDFEGTTFLQSRTEPMDIFWGTSSNRQNHGWMTASINETTVLEVLTSGYSGVKTSIPFNTTLFVRDLLHPVAPSSKQAREETDALIEGKVILYGANVTGVNDLIFTPTRDVLPGVYLHAMALDNLLHWAANYKSASGSGLLAKDGWHDLWRLLIVLPVAMLMALFHKGVRIRWSLTKLRRWRESGLRYAHRRPRLSKLCVWVLVASWFGAWALIEFFVFNFSAGTVADYLEFMVFGFFFGKMGVLDWIIDEAIPWIKKRSLAFWARGLAQYNAYRRSI